MVWDISPILLDFGPVQIRYYGLLFVATLLGGWQIWHWQVIRGGYTELQAERFFWIGVVSVILGARIGHVVFYEPQRFLENPLEILMIWRGGLASHGATIALVLGLFYYAKREQIRFWEVTDRFSMAAALGATLVRVGNFFNSEIVGRVTDVPWGIKFPRSYYDYQLSLEQVPTRHPSQLYEAAGGLTVLAVLYVVDRRYGENRPTGLLSALFLILYFSFRFLVEFFKAYQALDPDRSLLTMGQWLSVPFVALGAWLLLRVIREDGVGGHHPGPETDKRRRQRKKEAEKAAK